MDQLHIRMTTTLACVCVCVCVVPMHGAEVKSRSYVKYTLKPKDKMEDILHNTKKHSVLCGTTLNERTST